MIASVEIPNNINAALLRIVSTQSKNLIIILLSYDLEISQTKPKVFFKGRVSGV
jgi:hypothetical protein